LLDTSALYAAADPRETRHADTRSALEHLSRAGSPLWVTDLVVAELHGLALRRVGRAQALALIERLLLSPRIEVISSGSDAIECAVDLLRSRPDHDYSLTDAVSFVAMRERSIGTAFTLDEDFRAEGFATIPS
jgi:predicted nucleic acid-binding protein